MEALALVLLTILVMWGGVLLAFAAPLAARWREPVLKHPVLVVESDDWGAGPLRQAEALRSLRALLEQVRDWSGHPAVMTLGVVMEIPDGGRIADSNFTEYHALPVQDRCFDDVRAAIEEGIAAGVFAPQLHGQCHYWPPALLAAARADAAVRKWLGAAELAATEDLPSPLQSRWVDASTLPSRAIDGATIRQAISREAEAFATIWGEVPRVAVATTFVWDEAVESAWAEVGIEAIVTPGRRATCRSADGAPGCVDRTMLSGERSSAGPVYLVRDVYFEPILGHTPQSLVDALVERSRSGRACMVETHRFNFLRAPDASLAALGDGLQAALRACPNLRFVSSIELARALRARDPAWVETRVGPRLAAWRTRLKEIPRFSRVANWSGLGLLIDTGGGRDGGVPRG